MPAATGDCDLISRQEIERAFDGLLTVTEMSGRGARGSGCTISIAEGQEAQLVLQAGNRAAFQLRKDAYQSQTSMEPLDIGTEAYLVNGAQVIAMRDDDRSVSVGLMLISLGTETPVTPVVVAAGVQDIATRVLHRL